MKKFLLPLSLVLFIPLVAAAYSTFSDVSDGSWYTEAVNNLNEIGIVQGYSDGTFRPSSSVNRAELAVMFDRMMVYLDAEGYGAEYTENDTGITIYMNEGESFKVRIEDVTDGGYELEEPSYDSAVLHKQSVLDVAPESGAGDGADGHFIYSFEAQAAGDTDLTFTISRGGEDQETVFKAHVVVE